MWKKSTGCGKQEKMGFENKNKLCSFDKDYQKFKLVNGKFQKDQQWSKENQEKSKII